MTRPLAGQRPAVDFSAVAFDRIGPSGTLAADSAYAVALVGLWHDVARAGRSADFPPQAARSEVGVLAAPLVEQVRRGAAVGVAATMQRRLVGTALLRLGLASRAHTAAVSVLLVAEGHDELAGSLLARLLKIAGELGVDSVEVGLAVDDPLLAMFMAAGFAEAGRRPGWIGAPDGSVRDELLLVLGGR